MLACFMSYLLCYINFQTYASIYMCVEVRASSSRSGMQETIARAGGSGLDRLTFEPSKACSPIFGDILVTLKRLRSWKRSSSGSSQLPNVPFPRPQVPQARAGKRKKEQVNGTARSIEALAEAAVLTWQDERPGSVKFGAELFISLEARLCLNLWVSMLWGLF